MAVYVDPAVWPYGRMIMCHMVADSLHELHAMASRLGIDRRHFQGRARYPHYDICKAKRRRALELGARQVSTRHIIAVGRRLVEKG